MARKRANGDGSFFQRSDGRWEARVSLPSGDRKSVYGKTRAEVKLKVADIHDRVKAGLDVLTPDQTLAQYLERWLEDVVRPSVRPTTWESYESLIRFRVVPNLGRTKLNEVTPQQLQSIYNTLLKDGLSPTTVVRTHAVLHSAFRQAVRWNMIARNPTDATRPPRIVRQEMSALTRDQVQLLLEHASDPTMRALYAVAATAGLRRGELVALRWSDIDFDRSVLTVRRTAHRVRGEGIVYGEPKTKAGRRSVRIGALALSLLRAHRANQLEARLRAGPAWHDLNIVFSSAFGTPIEEARISRVFHRDLQRAGLPRVRMHDLRHTAATLLIEQGVNFKAVQAALGHSTIAITMDIYAHVTPAMQDSVAEAMDRLFSPAP
jgi:integrase